MILLLRVESLSPPNVVNSLSETYRDTHSPPKLDDRVRPRIHVPTTMVTPSPPSSVSDSSPSHSISPRDGTRQRHEERKTKGTRGTSTSSYGHFRRRPVSRRQPWFPSQAGPGSHSRNHCTRPKKGWGRRGRETLSVRD